MVISIGFEGEMTGEFEWEAKASPMRSGGEEYTVNV